MTLLSVVQMNSQDDIETNFIVIESLIQQSKAAGADLLFFLKTSSVLQAVNNVKLRSSLKVFSNV